MGAKYKKYNFVKHKKVTIFQNQEEQMPLPPNDVPASRVN